MRKSLAAAAVLTLPMALPASAAMASEDGSQTYVAQLSALNDSGASGTAHVTLSGDQMHVVINSQGVLPEMPHAQHVHYPEEEAGQPTIEGTCPTSAEDADGDGFVSTVEGAPAYGSIFVSLTTEGDVGPDSGLAVDRFPTAPGGTVTYDRTFTVPEGFDAEEDLVESVIVQHGIDVNGNGKYDMDGLGASELDPAVPAEATFPALCGSLSLAGSGGVAAGAGGTDGIENTGLFALGGASIVIAGGVVLYSRRRTQQG